MKVTHINTLDRGGAAKACTLIHKALLKQGVESKMLVLNPTKIEHEMYVFNYWHNIRGRFHALKKGVDMMLYDRKLRHRVQTLPAYNGMFTFPSTIYDITENEHYKSADIIQLNWTSGFLNEKTFFEKNDKPVIWRMADLYITGGGFHYEVGAPKVSFIHHLENNITIRSKALSAPNLNLNIVPISAWTKEKADESLLTKRFHKTIINCGIDTEVYKPYNSDLVKSLLGLPTNKKIILMGADSLSDPRKGMHLLMESLANVSISSIQLVAFGSSKIESKEHDILNLGFINDERLLAMLYSAADIFITPAIEEAFGQTSIEAQACGAALIAFATGGGTTVLTDHRLGVLVTETDSTSLRKAIETAINTDYDRNFIVESTIKRFDINDKAKEYIKLYQSILNK